MGLGKGRRKALVCDDPVHEERSIAPSWLREEVGIDSSLQLTFFSKLMDSRYAAAA